MGGIGRSITNMSAAVEALADSINAARKGDRAKVAAFKSLGVDISRERRPADQLLPALLKSGSRLDDKQGTAVARTLLGDIERLR